MTALICLGLLLAPSVSANAATLTIGSSCFRPGEPVSLRADGFAPRGLVTFEFGPAGNPFGGDGAPWLSPLGAAQADEAGSAALSFVGEDHTYSGLESIALRFVATEDTDPPVVAETQATQTAFAADLIPWIGWKQRPRTLRRLTVRGFTSGGRLYAHYLHRRTVRRTRVLGPLQPPCGALERRLRLFRSAHPHRGRWTIQLDTRPAYSRRTRPAYRLRFRIERTRRASRIQSVDGKALIR